MGKRDAVMREGGKKRKMQEIFGLRREEKRVGEEGEREKIEYYIELHRNSIHIDSNFQNRWSVFIL